MKLSVLIPVYNQEVLIKQALESVPVSCEIIVVDDGSTDGTMDTISKFRYEHPTADIKVFSNEVNSGVSVALNKALDNATGDYVVILGSDDDFYTEEFERVMDEMDGTDLIYFDLRVNDGKIFHLSPETKRTFCGSVKLVRREFAGDIRNPEDVRAGEDWFFFKQLMAKNPTEKYTNIVAKHYNWPREGSLTATGGKVE